MVSKYKLCRIGASLGVTVGIAVFLWGLYTYFMGIVSFSSMVINTLWNAFTYSNITVGIVVFALLCVFVICAEIGSNEKQKYHDTIFSFALACFITWIALIGLILLDSALALPEGARFPAGSGMAIVPSLLGMLFLIFYWSDAFNFCGKFKK